MAEIKIKRSSVEGKVPLVSDLQLGELAINTYDGKLYLKKNNGTESVVEIGSGSVSGGTATSFGITIDGGGSAITTGTKGFIRIPYNCTITGWSLLSENSGSIVIDVWKDTYANYPPTVSDSIAGSEKPTLTSAIKNENLAVTTWSTNIVAGDIIGFSVTSVTSVQKVYLSINTVKV